MLRPHATRIALTFLPSLLILPFVAARAPKVSHRSVANTTFPFEVNSSGDLKEGWHSDRTIRLVAGTEYVIAGECDDDCSDLDLQLFDNSGNVLKQDLDPDDTPRIYHTARYTGSYTLRVIMARCSVEPCSWWVSVKP